VTGRLPAGKHQRAAVKVIDPRGNEAPPCPFPKPRARTE